MCVCVCVCLVLCMYVRAYTTPYIHTPGYLNPQTYPCLICRYALLTRGKSPTIGSILVSGCKWTTEPCPTPGSSTSLRGGGRPETPTTPTGSTSASMCTRPLRRMTGLTLAATKGSYGWPLTTQSMTTGSITYPSLQMNQPASITVSCCQ